MKNLLAKSLKGQEKLEGVFSTESMDKILNGLYFRVYTTESLCSKISIELYRIAIDVVTSKHQEADAMHMISTFSELVFKCDSIEEKICTSIIFSSLKGYLRVLKDSSKNNSISEEDAKNLEDIERVFATFDAELMENLIAKYMYSKVSSKEFIDSKIELILETVMAYGELEDVEDTEKFKVYLEKIIRHMIEAMCDTYVYLYEAEYL